MTRNELKQLIKETINEAIEPTKVVGKYIYFIDSKELYSLNPYTLLPKRGCDITLANSWTRATIMQGEDVRDILGKQISDISSWYIVNNAPPDHTFTAYIGK